MASPGPTESRPFDAQFERVYVELKQLASRMLARDRRRTTLQTTALVHEAWLKLEQDRAADSAERARFLGLAAQAIRRILTDHARRRSAAKRGGARERVDLESALEAATVDNAVDIDHLLLSTALDELAQKQPRSAKVVEMRFYASMTEDEVATAMELSRRTVSAEWKFGRAWLLARLAREA